MADEEKGVNKVKAYLDVYISYVLNGYLIRIMSDMEVFTNQSIINLFVLFFDKSR